MVKLISINVGLPRKVSWNGRIVTTSIFKEPVSGFIILRTLNVEGDAQSDLSVHGGPNKAVYAYPIEHYDYWHRELPGTALPFGMFGENLTISGLLEDEVNIGDCFQIGSAEVMVTEPRLPCYKLGLKFGREDIIKRFLNSGRTGFYLAVLRQGKAKAGDSLTLVHRNANSVSVANIVHLYTHNQNDLELLQRAAQIDSLPQSWRDRFNSQIEKMNGRSMLSAYTYTDSA